MNVIIFYILASIILIFSLLSVTSKKILRAATYLLFVLIATAGLYFLLQINFLAAVQLMVYAGGITVLIIFSILLTSNIDTQFEKSELKKSIASAIAATIGAALCITTFMQIDFATVMPAESISPDIKTFGRFFLNYSDGGYILPFEVISILLLAAMVAAIMIAKKNKQ